MRPTEYNRLRPSCRSSHAKFTRPTFRTAPPTTFLRVSETCSDCLSLLGGPGTCRRVRSSVMPRLGRDLPLHSRRQLRLSRPLSSCNCLPIINCLPLSSCNCLPSPHPTAALSAKIYQGLLQIRMIDQQGNVLEDPRWVLGWVGGEWLGG